MSLTVPTIAFDEQSTLTPTPESPLTHNTVFGVAFSPDGTQILTGSREGIARLWDVNTGEVVRTFKDRDNYTVGAKFSSDGKYVFTNSEASYLVDDGIVRMWDANTGEEIHTFEGRNPVLWPDGSFLLTDRAGVPARLWDVNTGEVVQSFDHSFVGATISPDGKYVLAGNYPQIMEKIKLWDISKDQVVFEFPAVPPEVKVDTASASGGLAFSPDGTHTLINGGLGYLVLWDMQSLQPLASLSGISPGSVVFSPDGQSFATVAENGSVQVWNVDMKNMIREFTSSDNSAIRDFAFSPDGTLFLTANTADLIQLWNIETGAELKQYQIEVPA